MKQPIWILDILEGNRETLFFIIGIKALLGCFLAIILFLFIYLCFKRGRRFFFFEKINKEEFFFGCGSRNTEK